jgi:hypothetical protein
VKFYGFSMKNWFVDPHRTQSDPYNNDDNNLLLFVLHRNRCLHENGPSGEEPPTRCVARMQGFRKETDCWCHK